MEYEAETQIREPANPANPAAAPATHTTIVREKRGSSGFVVIALVIIALLAAGYFFMRSQDSEIVRDAAITDAANQVGESAQKAGAAIENAADRVTGE